MSTSTVEVKPNTLLDVYETTGLTSVEEQVEQLASTIKIINRSLPRASRMDLIADVTENGGHVRIVPLEGMGTQAQSPGMLQLASLLSARGVEIKMPNRGPEEEGYYAHISLTPATAGAVHAASAHVQIKDMYTPKPDRTTVDMEAACCTRCCGACR